jgi:hypothetical protein
MPTNSKTSETLSGVLNANLEKTTELKAKQGRLIELLKSGMKLPQLDGSTDSQPQTEEIPEGMSEADYKQAVQEGKDEAAAFAKHREQQRQPPKAPKP